jgi:hypothetical protein
MCALVTTKHSATKVAGGDASEFLDDLKRIGVRFVVGGSHAYREKLSNNYKPRDLDIVVFGEENVAVVREMLEDTGTPYLMNSVKGGIILKNRIKPERVTFRPVLSCSPQQSSQALWLCNSNTCLGF